MPISAKMFRLVTAWGSLVAGSIAVPAAAQCPTCGTPPVMAASAPCATCAAPPVCNVCENIQPVIQPCYQTVPVTEYRPTKQMVQKPVCDVEYVDQPITAYRPICETKTAEVPTVTWQTVNECRTVQRDMGRWVTHYECRPKVSPCEYDPRPGFMGWWNRTSYSMRSSFTPTTVARRTWCPNVVTQTYPVARQVPQYGTRQVSYNVTRMEPYTTTRKVAVNKVRYVAEEVTTMQPVTVMRTVPIGTSVAWAVTPYGAPYGGSSTALAPSPDPLRSAERGFAPPPRGGDRLPYDERERFSRGAKAPVPFGSEGGRAFEEGETVKPKKISVPVVRPAEGSQFPEARVPTPVDTENTSYGPETTVPSVVKASRWAPRGARTSAKPVVEGPALQAVSVTAVSGK